MPHIIKTTSLVTGPITPGSATIAINLVTLLGNVGQGRGTTTPGTGTTTTLGTPTLATMITTMTTTRVEGNTHPALHARRPTIPQTSATSRRFMIKLKLQLWQRLGRLWSNQQIRKCGEQVLI